MGYNRWVSFFFINNGLVGFLTIIPFILALSIMITVSEYISSVYKRFLLSGYFDWKWPEQHQKSFSKSQFILIIKRMDITHRFYNQITYDLTVACSSDRINMKMQVQDLRSSKTFEKVVDHNGELKEEFPKTGEFFEFMGN